MVQAVHQNRPSYPPWCRMPWKSGMNIFPVLRDSVPYRWTHKLSLEGCWSATQLAQYIVGPDCTVRTRSANHTIQTCFRYHDDNASIDLLRLSLLYRQMPTPQVEKCNGPRPLLASWFLFPFGIVEDWWQLVSQLVGKVVPVLPEGTVVPRSSSKSLWFLDPNCDTSTISAMSHNIRVNILTECAAGYQAGDILMYPLWKNSWSGKKDFGSVLQHSFPSLGLALIRVRFETIVLSKCFDAE